MHICPSGGPHENLGPQARSPALSLGRPGFGRRGRAPPQEHRPVLPVPGARRPRPIYSGLKVRCATTNVCLLGWANERVQRSVSPTMDGHEQFDREEIAYPFELGTKVSFGLDSPCNTFVRGLLCNALEGYLEIKPWQSGYHFSQWCINGHYVKNVRHAEVELALGLPRTGPEKSAVRDALSPPARIRFLVLIRDNATCVYCGQRANDLDLDGKRIAVGADHIIPRRFIDYEEIRLDRSLVVMARDLQLVTACRAHNSAKGTFLISLDQALDLFVRHVLKNETRGPNLGVVQRFETLYRLAERRVRLKGSTA
jgi:hypothetical protein